MKINEMTETIFDREMASLLGQVQFWCIRLTDIDPHCTLEPAEASYLDGTGKQPFPLAIELKRCWDYARGEGKRPDEMDDIVQSLTELLWAPVGGGTYVIPAEWWETPLGVMCELCNARTALDRGDTIGTNGLAVLAGLTHRRIKQLCRSGEIKAEKTERSNSPQQDLWEIPVSEARRFLESRR